MPTPTDDKRQDREYTTPERQRDLNAPDRAAPDAPATEHPDDWRSAAAGTSRHSSPGPAEGDAGRDEAEEESLRRQAQAGLEPKRD